MAYLAADAQIQHDCVPNAAILSPMNNLIHVGTPSSKETFDILEAIHVWIKWGRDLGIRKETIRGRIDYDNLQLIIDEMISSLFRFVGDSQVENNELVIGLWGVVGRCWTRLWQIGSAPSDGLIPESLFALATKNLITMCNRAGTPVASSARIHPTSLRQFVIDAISGMSASAIISTALPGRFPVVAAFQSHFLHRFIALTSRDCHVAPCPADDPTIAQQMDRRRIDLYIHTHLCWCVELCVKGDPMRRFNTTDTFAKSKVKDFIVIDIRPGPVTVVDLHEKLATAFFDE